MHIFLRHKYRIDNKAGSTLKCVSNKDKNMSSPVNTVEIANAVHEKESPASFVDKIYNVSEIDYLVIVSKRRKKL